MPEPAPGPGSVILPDGSLIGEPYVLYADDAIGISEGETVPYVAAATVYDGYLADAAGIVKGQVQVKVAKGKLDKKSGLFSAKVAATVQMADGAKLSFKNGVADAAGTVTSMSAGGHVLDVFLGVSGLGGSFDGYRIDGARNVFSAKDKKTKELAAAIEKKWGGSVNVAGDGVVLAVSIAKKGKVKVSGSVNGVTVSATSQLLVGEEVCCIPVVITKKANLAFNLWLAGDGSVEIAGLDGATVGKAGALKGGAAFGMNGAALERALPGLLADYLPDGLAVGLNKTKWVVAPDEKGKAAKAGKVAINKKTGEIDETKLGENPSALKLTYTAKSGSFKGSFKAYALDAKGKIKSYTVNVTGVMVGGTGYGTATLKKPAVSWPVAVE